MKNGGCHFVGKVMPLLIKVNSDVNSHAAINTKNPNEYLLNIHRRDGMVIFWVYCFGKSTI